MKIQQVVTLDKEQLEDLIHKIKNENYFDFDGCFCGSLDYEIGTYNNSKLFLNLSVSCRKSSGCDNPFYTLHQPTFSIEEQDEEICSKLKEWHYNGTDDDYLVDFNNLYLHNFEDIVLRGLPDEELKLKRKQEKKLRMFIYELYKEMYSSNPLEYDENFKI